MFHRRQNTPRGLTMTLVMSSAWSVAAADDDFSFFEAKIRPVLLDHCRKWNTAGGNRPYLALRGLRRPSRLDGKCRRPFSPPVAVSSARTVSGGVSRGK